MGKQYGLPYMGSKSKIAESILQKLPKAKNFYDLFGGGFAISHCAAESFRHKWEMVHYNEIKKGLPEFVRDCISGKYNYERFLPKWISREEFLASDDMYVKIVWSFGNNQCSYLFSEENERLKKSLHNAVVFNEFDEQAKNILGFDRFYFKDIKKRRLAIKKKIPAIGVQQLERLQQLEQLERLERLEGINNIKFYNTSYDLVPIESDSIIYCDPPYQGTQKYDKNGFNHARFWEWVRDNKNPVFVSEYKAPDFMKVIKEKEHRSILSATANNLVKEILFCNEAGFNLWLG